MQKVTMKLYSCFLLGLMIMPNLHSQTCEKLDSISFFASIKFGAQIPGDLTICSGKEKIETSNYIDYHITYDSLKQSCKKKYADLFTFYSVPFSYLLITANKRGQMYSVELYSFFTDSSRTDAITFQPPSDFTRIYDKLVSSYGKPTRIEDATNTDSFLIKEMGMPRLTIWECNNTELRLRIRYGSRQKELNVIDIQIIKKVFEFPEQTKLLQNDGGSPILKIKTE